MKTTYFQTSSQPTENTTAPKLAFLKMVSDILRSFERQNITTVVILNLSADFDTVDHDMLLTVLKDHFGFCE